ncbi:MAG: hypothetical protein M3P12_06815 [Gemmatimonadota bacterium]|nr:hypothetical protein [Gemmatimonadota bacterium]
MHAKRLLLLSLLLVMACKPPTPAEQLDSILSWIGTAGMAGDAWLRHTTPDAYTRQTLDLSLQALEQISTDLLGSSLPRTDTATLDSILTRSRASIRRMAALVKPGNSSEFSRELDLLRANRKVLEQFSDSIDASQ